MWRAKSVSGDYSYSTSFGASQIPIGLAKLFQQFAPFVDTVTGSVYQTTITPADPIGYINYPSIDLRLNNVTLRTRDTFLPPWVDLNCPLSRFIISSTNQAGDIPDYAACFGIQASVYMDDLSQPLTEWISDSINGSQIRLMQNLYEVTIAVDEIPLYAPDGSAYTYFTSGYVASPTPQFSSPISVMCGHALIEFNETPDYFTANYVYDKPFPCVRNPSQQGSVDFRIKRLTLLGTYAYMTSFAEKWTNGVAKELMLHARELSGATSFSYRMYQISFFRVALLVRDVLRTDPWVGTGTEISNQLFSLTQLTYSAVFQRLFQTASFPSHPDQKLTYRLTNDQNTYPVSPCFYAASGQVTATRFPSVIAKAISNIGPVVVGKKILFPYWEYQKCYNSSFPVSYPPSQTTPYEGWFNAVTPNAMWDVSTFNYSLAATPGLQVSITYPGSNSLLIYTLGYISVSGYLLPVCFGYNMSYLQAAFATYYANRYPDTFASDRWVPLSSCRLGGLSSATVIPFATFDTSATFYKTTYFSIRASVNHVNSYCRLCLTNKDVMEGTIYGLVPLQTDQQNDLFENDNPPLIVDFGPSMEDPQVQLQIAINQSGNSQYQGFLNALLSKDKSLYGASMEMLQPYENDLLEETTGNPTPSYSALESYYDNVRGVVSTVSKEASRLLYPYALRSAGQGAAGLVRYFLFRYFRGRRQQNAPYVNRAQLDYL